MKKAVLKIGNRQIVVVKSENGYAFAGVENDAFKEADHPRDKGGKFTSKGGAGSGSGSKGKPAEKKEPENKESVEKVNKIKEDVYDYLVSEKGDYYDDEFYYAMKRYGYSKEDIKKYKKYFDDARAQIMEKW